MKEWLVMSKYKELLKKRKLIVMVSVIIIVVAGIATYVLTRKPKEILKVVKQIDVEYGQEIPTEVSEYVDTKGLSTKEKKELLRNAKVEVDFDKAENATYPKIGEYKAVITYKEESKTTKVVVKDTTAPIFGEIESIEFVQGSDIDYSQYIQAEDLQAITYEFKDETVNKEVVGEYVMKVLAKDASNNVAEKEITVKVLEAPSEAQEVEVVVDEQGNVKTVVKDKNKETENNNNNTSNNNQNTGNENSGDTGGNKEEKPSGTENMPVVEADYVANSYFIDNIGNKWIQGRDYIFASVNVKDCYDYVQNTLGGNGGYASANLRDGGKIYYVTK
jgi:hypothetical protein